MPPRKLRSVDHEFLAGLCARHLSGNYEAAVDRCCQQWRLGATDKLRLQRLAAQQAALEKAVEQAAGNGNYVAAPPAKSGDK